ncbi:MAG: 5-formyltetrahydrofolate cyclo-ligase [Ignavibacteria bacterium]|jgi:5-formyltetrahydrofolate cyclo-ligase
MMNHDSVIEKKKKLRQQYEEIRASLSIQEREMSEQNIMEYVFASVVYNSSDIICSFVSFGSEVSTKQLNDKILESGKTLCLPRIMGTRKMEMIEVNSHTTYVMNKYGINEPIGQTIQLTHEFNALCIVPLLAYDSFGHRLGYGGGFYDVFLGEHQQMLTLGIAFSKQYSETELPYEEHDAMLKMIINEHGLHQTKKKKPA